MKFRLKQPVTVEAIQFTGDNETEVFDFLSLHYDDVDAEAVRGGKLLRLSAGGLNAHAERNDWIVVGYDHPEILSDESFRKRYEETP